MLRPNLDNIATVPFAAGYGIRPMTTDDIGLWTDIQRDAEPFVKITDTLFHEQFGADGFSGHAHDRPLFQRAESLRGSERSDILHL